MSLIKTAPTGRRPVKVHVGEWDEDVVSAAVRLELARGGQVYYVSNRVKSIDDAVMRVMSVAPEARVRAAHGQMSERELENVMQAFVSGEVDVLVATTIIESGIDNPHTNTLIIEDAQRLGLAQLDQLKGRVGRGRLQAYAYFMFPPELPLTPEATERLVAIGERTDLGSGMKIAMRDLEIRGAGSLMGAEQHGNLSSVGFDLYTQMLGEAVALARGEEPAEAAETTVAINLPADYYLDEEYVRDVDKRVLAYRKLAALTELEGVDALARELEQTYGEPPLAARNLFDRARIRIEGGPPGHHRGWVRRRQGSARRRSGARGYLEAVAQQGGRGVCQERQGDLSLPKGRGRARAVCPRPARGAGRRGRIGRAGYGPVLRQSSVPPRCRVEGPAGLRPGHAPRLPGWDEGVPAHAPDWSDGRDEACPAGPLGV